MTETDAQLILRAAALAAQLHQDQRRKGTHKRPYINHPLEVAQQLAAVGGVTDAQVLAAAILHDTVEDTSATAEDIELGFGPRIAALVAEVTDDKALPKAERKRQQIVHAPHMSREAGLIKTADKTANVLDLVRDPPPDWSHARVVAYLDWAESVVGGLLDPDPALLAGFKDAIFAGRRALSTSKEA